MRICLTLVLLCLVLLVRAQDASEQIIFDPEPANPASTDSRMIQPRPAIGYDSLFRYLETRLSEADTIGKRYELRLDAIRIVVRATGVVDSIYIGIPHMACSIHRLIISELKTIRWKPAQQYGKPITWDGNLSGRVMLTKRVYKKYRC
jgi:hypothetical protein